MIAVYSNCPIILLILSHPDFTVGSGITPDHTFRLAGCTAGREFHPALKIIPIFSISFMITTQKIYVKSCE